VKIAYVYMCAEMYNVDALYRDAVYRDVLM